MSSELHILVGIPACGKTTWAFANDHAGCMVFSSDAIREELTGDATVQGVNDQVFILFHKRITDALARGYNVIADATNLKPSSRTRLMDIALSLEVPAYARRFRASEDYDTCQARNLARERVVPEDVMRRFHRNFRELCTREILEQEGWVVYEV